MSAKIHTPNIEREISTLFSCSNHCLIHVQPNSSRWILQKHAMYLKNKACTEKNLKKHKQSSVSNALHNLNVAILYTVTDMHIYS